MKYLLIILLGLLLSCNKEEYHLWVKSKPVINITDTTAQSGGYFHTMSNMITSHIISKGIVWTTDDPPTLTYNDGRTYDSGTYDWTSFMTNLEPSTTYYVRVYVELQDKVYYTAPSVKFTTQSQIND